MLTFDRLRTYGLGALPVLALVAPFIPGHAQRLSYPSPREVSHAHVAHVTSAMHLVRSGETLSQLARHYYGKASYWPTIWWANRHEIHNPSLLLIGQRLVIPLAGSGKPDKTITRQAIAHIPVPPPAPAPAPPQPVTVQAAAPSSPPAAAPAPAQSSYSGAGGFQSCVIAAESGGNPSAVNPSSGAGGLYQFLPSTWSALGFPGLPENASIAMQNAAFQKEYAQSGTSAWGPYDGC